MSVTVVVASYRYGHLVAHAVDSVLSQTKKPERVVVLDDGVGDCRGSLAGKYDVELIERPENMGVVANFQDALVNHVSTDRVMFLGADNWLRLDALEVLSAKSADIVSYDIALVGQDAERFAGIVGAGDRMHGHPVWRFRNRIGNISSGNYIHGSALYNADLARRAGGYSASGNTRTEEDWMLWIKMLRAGATHEHVDEPFLYYRRHVENFYRY